MTGSVIKFGLVIVIVFLAIFVLWAGIAPLDSASVAQGSVVLNSSRKTIQHLEGGIITEILVKEGDMVVTGQPLVKLNQLSAKAEKESLLVKLQTALATEARLIAERDNSEEIKFDDLLLANIADEQVAKIIDSQQKLFEARHNDINGQIELLEQRIAQLDEEQEGIKSQHLAAAAQRKLIDEEVKMTEELHEKGLASKTRVLTLKRGKSSIEGTIGNLLTDAARVKEKISELQTEIHTVQNKYTRDVMNELKDVQAQLVELKEKFSAKSDTFERTVISAPQSGKITGLKYHTVGGVITPGAAIMDIVPQDDNLIVEAKVSPNDIDVIHDGLQAKVMLTAYRSRSVPRLDGNVIYVSADKFSDEKNGFGYFMARVEIDKKELEELSDEIKLYPGMPAEVFIITGSRTFLGYLLTPLRDTFHRAFREE